MAPTVAPVASWADRLKTRLYEQFKGKPNWIALVDRVWAPQMDQLEAAAQSLLTLPSIDDSSGFQLDVIGKIVGQPRAGLDDPTYRLILRGKIRANRSQGTPEDLYAVLVAAFGVGTQAVYAPGGDASFDLRLVAPMADSEVGVIVSLVGDAKPAGVRGVFEWQEAADALMLFTALSDNAASPVSIGDGTVTVNSTAAFPASGQVTIDGGLANAETLSFTRFSPTVLNVPSLATQNHSVGAEVELVGDPGLGLGDSTNALTGGELAGALQA